MPELRFECLINNLWNFLTFLASSKQEELGFMPGIDNVMSTILLKLHDTNESLNLVLILRTGAVYVAIKEQGTFKL